MTAVILFIPGHPGLTQSAVPSAHSHSYYYSRRPVQTKKGSVFTEPFRYKVGDYRISSRAIRDSHNQQCRRRILIRIIIRAGLYKQKRAPFLRNPFVIRSATTYSPTISSTIGADGFNFSVRNGKRWSPAAIVTLRLYPPDPPNGGL